MADAMPSGSVTVTHGAVDCLRRRSASARHRSGSARRGRSLRRAVPPARGASPAGAPGPPAGGTDRGSGRLPAPGLRQGQGRRRRRRDGRRRRPRRRRPRRAGSCHRLTARAVPASAAARSPAPLDGGKRRGAGRGDPGLGGLPLAGQVARRSVLVHPRAPGNAPESWYCCDAGADAGVGGEGLVDGQVPPGQRRRAGPRAEHLHPGPGPLPSSGAGRHVRVDGDRGPGGGLTACRRSCPADRAGSSPGRRGVLAEQLTPR